MPIYLYRCTKCNNVFDVNKSMKDRDCSEKCPECSSDSNREFDPSAGSIIMWKNADSTRPTTSGPTRKNRYTVGDVADEKNWWKKWGIKNPAHKSQKCNF